jgi:hypothetical protein
MEFQKEMESCLTLAVIAHPAIKAQDFGGKNVVLFFPGAL